MHPPPRKQLFEKRATIESMTTTTTKKYNGTTNLHIYIYIYTYDNQYTVHSLTILVKGATNHVCVEKPTGMRCI